MTTHTMTKLVTERWSYSTDDVERLVLEDIFGRADVSGEQVCVKFLFGQSFVGVEVTHTYMEEQ